jgi:hypothetical protein
MFSGKKFSESEHSISAVFLSVLGHAPDKCAFLGEFYHRVHPRSWSGSLAIILAKRKAQLAALEDHADADVRQWVADAQSELDRWIESETGREREQEESFE